MTVDDQKLQEIWDNWKPYHSSDNGKFRSYVADKTEIDTDADCIHLVQAQGGGVYQLEE